MIVNMQQITFMYGVEAAEAMIKKAWPKYEFKDRLIPDRTATTLAYCSYRDWNGMEAHNNYRREFIAENT